MTQAYVSYISGKKQACPCFVHYTLTITSILDKVTFRIIQYGVRTHIHD